MHLIQKLSGQGFKSLTDQEIEKLMHELMFTPTNFGHLSPLLKAELESRHAAVSNRRAMYISIFALLVSIGSFIQSFILR